MADIQPHADWLHALIGLKTPHLLAGLVGGVVRGVISPAFSWPQRITSAVIGAAVAGYLTPAAAPVARRWLETASGPGDIEGSVGFALGLVGMTVCDALIRIAKRWHDGPGGRPQ